jgi:hypothetical protein
VGGLVVAALLLPVWGVTAVACGLALAEGLAIGWFLPFAVERRFGFPALAHLAGCYAVGALALGWSFGVATLSFAVLPDGAVFLPVAGLLWAVVALPPIALVVLPRTRRQDVIRRLRGFLPGRVAS